MGEEDNVKASRVRRARSAAALVSLIAAAAVPLGCGGSGGALSVPQIAPARAFSLAGFQPTHTVLARRPTTISFTVRLPSGKPLTSYRTGPGPHTGVHLIIVREDLAYLIHEHPPVSRTGLIRQTVTLPAPGPYRVLVDVYPNIPGGQPNFQLSQTVRVSGPYRPRPLPSFAAEQTVDGYHIHMQPHPPLHAIQAQFVTVDVTDSLGRRVTFRPWFGALAHAIFFREASLDYFHSHVCAPNAPNCGSLSGVGASRVTGRATAAGRLSLGALLPEPGTWRLFLQMKLGRTVVTAPFTLHVAS